MTFRGSLMSGSAKYILAAFLLFPPAFGWAEPASDDKDKAPDQRPGWTAGVGGIYLTRPYRSIDNRFIPLPFVAYRGPRFTLFGPQVSYLLATRGTMGFSATANWRFSGYDPDDSPFLNGMKKRHDTLEAGAAMEASLPAKTTFHLHWRADTLGHHNGYETEISLRRDYPMGRFNLAPSVAWTFLSPNLANTYYGVRTQEALPKRPAYKPSRAHALSAGLMAFFQANRKMSWFGGFSIGRLSSELTRSPIVSERVETQSYLGVMWNLRNLR